MLDPVVGAPGETRSYWPPAQARRPVKAKPRPATPLDDSLFLAGALAWCAGGIHVDAAILVASENLAFSAFFAGLAIAQFMLGFAIIRRPGRRILILAAILNLAIVGLWIASRAGSITIGTDPVTPTGFIAGVNEIVLALVVLRHLRAERGGVPLRPVKHLLTMAGTFSILLSCLMLTFGPTSTSNVPGPVSFLCHLG